MTLLSLSAPKLPVLVQPAQAQNDALTPAQLSEPDALRSEYIDPDTTQSRRVEISNRLQEIYGKGGTVMAPAATSSLQVPNRTDSLALGVGSPGLETGFGSARPDRPVGVEQLTGADGNLPLPGPRGVDLRNAPPEVRAVLSTSGTQLQDPSLASRNWNGLRVVGAGRLTFDSGRRSYIDYSISPPKGQKPYGPADFAALQSDIESLPGVRNNPNAKAFYLPPIAGSSPYQRVRVVVGAPPPGTQLVKSGAITRIEPMAQGTASGSETMEAN